MNILIVTGGTGGHIYPALALADAAKEKYEDLNILFVGNDDRMETSVIPAHGYAFKALHASGLNGNVFHKGKALFLMGKAYVQALSIVKQFKADIAIGFGGYVSAPLMLAAHHEGVACMIHEQNSVVGFANRKIAKYMDAIVICYERLYKDFDQNKTKLLGNPRASSAMQVPFDINYFHSLHLSEHKPLILVVMGSLGSTSMNTVMCEALPKVDPRYQILFVTGKDNYEEVKKNMVQQDNLHVVDYVKQLQIMAKVDLIICRAGATTAAEITALGTPSIIIPSPYVAHNHQFYNASVLAQQKAAFMIEEKNLKQENLIQKIEQVMGNEKLRESMSKQAKALGFPNASKDILSWIDDMKR